MSRDAHYPGEAVIALADEMVTAIDRDESPDLTRLIEAVRTWREACGRLRGDEPNAEATP